MESERILDDVLSMSSDKINLDSINLADYVSTDNMQPYFGGVTEAEKLPSVSKISEYRENDILFSNIRTYFRKLWIANKDGGCSNDIIVFRAKDSIDPKFAFYTLMNEDFIQYTVQTSKGTKMPRGDKDAIKKYPISLPSPQEQKAIAHILGSLDDKIELNRQMNETLEAMAQALFKSWFVDFDPVIDNALAAGNAIPDIFAERALRRSSGRSVTSSDDVFVHEKEKPHKSGGVSFNTHPSTLRRGSGRAGVCDDDLSVDPESVHPELSRRVEGFPDAFEYTEEMGWIPVGWKVTELSNLITIKHGYAFKGEFFSKEETEDILLTPGNFNIGGGFKANKFKYYNGPIPEDYILEKNDLLVTMTDLSKVGDTLGYPLFVPEGKNKRYLHNQRLGKVEIIESGIGKEFLYRCLCSKSYRDDVLSNVSGSTVKHTSPTKIMMHQITFSGGRVEEMFESLTKEFSIKRQNNDSANHSLSKLRDTLLPKLLSGELRISDAEKLIEEEI